MGYTHVRTKTYLIILRKVNLPAMWIVTIMPICRAQAIGMAPMFYIPVIDYLLQYAKWQWPIKIKSPGDIINRDVHAF